MRKEATDKTDVEGFAPLAGASERSPTIDVVSRMQRVLHLLSPAERAVADIVSSDFEAATRMTIADLANRAEVSQPSVTRFCRSVGFGQSVRRHPHDLCPKLNTGRLGGCQTVTFRGTRGLR